MNGVNLYIIISSITLTGGSILLNFTGRQKYKDNASFFESANNELREQNTNLKEENTTLKTQLATAEATILSQDKTIEQLKPFSEVVTTMSNNHLAIMKAVTDLTNKMTRRTNNGHQRISRKKSTDK